MKLYINGEFHAMNKSLDVFSALLENEGKIADTGDSDALVKKYPDAEVCDLGGKCVIPGIADTHTHLCWSAYSEMTTVLPAPLSNKELLADLSERVKKAEKGEWIIYLGADDYYFPDGLQFLMEISDDKSDVLYGTCELRFNRTRRIRRNTPLENIGYRLPACHQSMAMRRTAIEHLGGFKLEYPVYGDLDLMQRAYRAGFRFNACDSVISSFFVGGVSSDNLSALSELYNLMRANKIVKYPRIVILRFYIMTLIFKLWHRIK